MDPARLDKMVWGACVSDPDSYKLCKTSIHDESSQKLCA